MLEVEKYDIGNKDSGATMVFFPHYRVEHGKKFFFGGYENFCESS